jgi:hypothetical protein
MGGWHALSWQPAFLFAHEEHQNVHDPNALTDDLSDRFLRGHL